MHAGTRAAVEYNTSQSQLATGRQEHRNAFTFVICVQLQELLACKTSLETSLKEVDNSIPSLQQQLDATLSSSQETRHNSKALQQEAAELQSVSTVVRKNYIM